ncbi:MAG: hypothetical protein JRI94_11975 [Deltaproteobacteria bacterium]|nr:hypothetical protein [Deltaproteobacteria bacterium]MBW2034284.1 hypothetical protein [Deltaproteobacteria bacterium]
MFKKYTITGENNPIWWLVEPVILKTWAEGMCKASYPQLYLIHFMALLLSTVMFLGGFVLRILLVGTILFLGYAVFEESLTLAFSAVFPSFGMDTTIMNNVDESSLWIYQVLGYVILIKSVIFVFGKNFTDWVQDTALYLLMMVTGMIPLKWIARGLIRKNYFAQLAAKTSFMGMHMSQTISAAPPDIEQQYSKIFDLYQKSNDENARNQLEELCATY